MKHFLQRCLARHLPAAAWAVLLMLANSAAFGAPGAHGPNGEHLDAPTAVGTGAALPRMEARSEAFELVATLHAGELSVLIDRFDSNEPVLNAALEVESGGLKAKASFHTEQGDYAVDDAQFMALLRKPGEHALVFTLTAGKDSDLLDGTLVTAAPGAAAAAAGGGHGHAHGGQDVHGHGHAREYAAWAGVAALAMAGGIVWWRRRRNSRNSSNSSNSSNSRVNTHKVGL